MPFSRTTATAAMAAAQLPKGNNSVVDLLTRVPVNRGSLVKSIENLLKTIEMSENAVMIPTLLRDKVRVDAWELLFVAKILKASILGHGDLVEFYMNHLNSDCEQQDLDCQQASPQQQQQHQLNGLQNNIIYEAPSSVSSSSGSISSTSTATNGNGTGDGASNSRATGGSSSSSTSWTTATNGAQADFISELAQQTAQEALLAARPLLAQQQQQQQTRQTQPPSLLQLTTTNNHINSLLQYPDSSPVSGQATPVAVAGEQQQQLTISTSNGNRAAELRTSRSAGCLFRSNSSGSSSPRTTAASGHLSGQHHTAPNTPLGGQADLPIGANPGGELPGDPSALVKLLMQIEQLKSSIAHVSSQLESVVELYKRSIDNIST